MTISKTLLLATTCAGLALSAAARAEDAAPVKASDEVSTVVVTAQKREQKLQDVPMAITVAGADQLDRQQITQVHDLDRISPAVSFVDGAPGGGAGIRGIATQSFTPSAEASVGIVVDGVPQGNVNASNLFDMQRVEVLRGPQGMLFGQSSSAGVINMVTQAPKLGEVSGRLHIDYADDGSVGSKYGERVLQGVINLPVTENSAARISVFENRNDGVEKDVGSGQKDIDDDFGFRVRYLANLSANLKLNLIADYDRDDQSGPSLFTVRATPNASTQAALAACGITPSASNQAVCGAYATGSNLENGGLSAELDYQLGDYTLTSITAYRGRDAGPTRLDIQDLKGVVPQLYYTNDNLSLRQTSQELRLTSPGGQKLEWVAGLYLARFTNWEDNGGLNIGLPFATIHKETQNSTKIETAALFGQTTYHFTDSLSAFVGVRANRETVSDHELFSVSASPPIPFLGPFYSDVPASASTTISNLSGRFGLEYRLSPDLMVYTSAARGYKGPQINDTVFGVTPTVIKPELPTAFELGVKGQTHGVGLDLNIFYDDVKNYQGQQCVFTPALTCGAENVPKVITKGVELDLFGKPLPGLTLNGGFIYNPVKYPGGFVGSDGTVVGGEQLTGAPLYKLNLSAEYVFDLTSSYQGFASFETTFKSKTQIYPSALAAYSLPDRWITGGRVGVIFPDRRTRLSIYVRNIGNTSDPINLYPGPATGDVVQKLDRQGLRIVGVSLDTKF